MRKLKNSLKPAEKSSEKETKGKEKAVEKPKQQENLSGWASPHSIAGCAL